MTGLNNLRGRLNIIQQTISPTVRQIQKTDAKDYNQEETIAQEL